MATVSPAGIAGLQLLPKFILARLFGGSTDYVVPLKCQILAVTSNTWNLAATNRLLETQWARVRTASGTQANSSMGKE